MLKFFRMTSETIKLLYKGSSKETKSNSILVLEDTFEGSGLYGKSDLIFVFGQGDELVLLTERLNKKAHRNMSWFVLKLYVSLTCALISNTHSNKGIELSYSIHKDYIDITHYKNWWYEVMSR